MSQRLEIESLAPDGHEAVLALERYLHTRIDRRLLELVKLRASILNGCAFCVDMHTSGLLHAGEDVRRVAAVAVWQESPFFSDAERATLALTDAVTRLDEGGVSDEVWSAAVDAHGEKATADLLYAIATINVWNRLSVAVRKEPPALVP